jgi:predicted transcriptional regulator
MPEDTLDATNLKSQYVSQVAGDLERNAKEQERISAELTALEEQLQALRHDHALLVSMREALTGESSAPLPDGGTGTASPEPTAAPRPAAVPTARKPKESGKSADDATADTKTSGSKTAGSKTAGSRTAGSKTAGSKTAGSKAGAKGRKKSQPAPSPAKEPKAAGAPTLRDLVLDHLGGQSEPRSAAEVTTGLAEAHPDRTFQGTVVRNTLEALVAKGHVQRNKQQKSVFYFAAGNPPVTASPASAAETDDAAQKVEEPTA